MPPVVLVALLVAATLVVAVPVRRLRLDGRSTGTILGYTVVLLALALGVTELRPLARYLLPALGLVYLAPFVTWRGGLDRLLDRLLGRRMPVVRVSHPDRRVVEPPRDVTPRGSAHGTDDGTDDGTAGEDRAGDAAGDDRPAS